MVSLLLKSSTKSVGSPVWVHTSVRIRSMEGYLRSWDPERATWGGRDGKGENSGSLPEWEVEGRGTSSGGRWAPDVKGGVQGKVKEEGTAHF